MPTSLWERTLAAMDVGVMLMRQISSSPEDVRFFSTEAERLSYHSIWVTEHIAIPLDMSRSRYPYSPDGRPAFTHETDWTEAMVTLGYVAACTRRIRLGTAVIPMITRDPLSMAKQAATVDTLSDGRLELGLGAGWLLEEAEVLGHPADHRGARLDEAIDIMRKAWTEASFEHDGRFWKIPRVGVHPQPPQGGDVPIWIGGTRPAAIRTTAERAVGNIIWLAPPEEVAEMRAKLPGERRLAVSMRFDMNGSGVADQARSLRQAGADLLILIPHGDVEKAVRDIERFEAEVRPILS